ncbi:hypothetical protein OG599_03860 [Streptomyces sp. NBC_01335]|uniref:hypothetical protein n=1 Tax=Streptomyces sp. NBC_01335 TaxID=2903828 RepID=UPI002E1022B4|nr:hypothetical protein OG599_03860 [Streptomyces sp. NBC_01335]
MSEIIPSFGPNARQAVRTVTEEMAADTRFGAIEPGVYRGAKKFQVAAAARRHVDAEDTVLLQGVAARPLI